MVDVFDALTSERPYKEPMSLSDALNIIRQDSGRHFDPAVVDVFHVIGPDLYAQIALANENELRQRLGKALFQYFN